MTLEEMLQGDGATIDEVAAHLDGLDPDERVRQSHALRRGGQRALFQLAASAPPVDFEHFVPAAAGSACEVRHRGRNTLPLPKSHQYFEKRFARPADGRDGLYGFNEGPSRKLIGPGYFVAIHTAGNADWQARGPVVVDYLQVPPRDAVVPDGWPAIVSNSRGLQWFVYRGTRDFMRRVSKHVSIGAAFKGERALDHYFILVRDPSFD